MAALGVYVHLPWCVRRCPYCDFNAHEMRGVAPFADYVAALLEDLEEDLPLAAGRPVGSVFFGGGTPSLCPPVLLGRFLEGLAARLPLEKDAEITLEANPGTIEHGQFQDYAAAGINRISLGVQSFQPRLLQAIGRIHGPQEAHAAIEELHRAGIANFNLDLMYGLPGQDPGEAEADVAAALAAAPTHLSLYQLTLEPGTPFFRHPPELPDEGACEEMEQAAGSLLAEAGLHRYEISAWARPGSESRHNLNYWEFGDYLGLGAGAHGKLSLDDGRIVRRTRRRRPATWLEGPRIEAEEALGTGRLVFEFMLNALRLTHGFDLARFEARTGLEASRAMPGLERGRERGLLECTGDGRWRPTPLGARFLNDAQALFLPPRDA